MRTSSRRPRGFTLLEVLIAFAIVAISLAAMMRAAGFGVAAVHHSDRYEEALTRARSHLAGLAAGFENLSGPGQGDDGNGYEWRLDIRPFTVPQEATTGPPPRPTPMLYRVTVTISWVDGGGTRAVRLTSDRLGVLSQ